MRAKWTAVVLTVAVILLDGCATNQIAQQSHDLGQQIAAVDSAYRNLKSTNTQTYNASLRVVANQMERESSANVEKDLAQVHVKLDRPAIKLPLASYQLVRSSQQLFSNSVGVPILLDFDTARAPVYPPDGLLVAGTLIYKRAGQSAHLSPVTGKTSIELNGTRYPLAIDNYALGVALRHQTRGVARIGLHRMLHPMAPGPKMQIYLMDPYDPNKIPVLLVHGLQSTPVTFLNLVDAIRSDPELSQRYQIWTFLYGSGTPVLFNALTLRRELERTLRAVDPRDHDFATRHIVVIGHSMGGVMAHTLVSSSGDKVWNSLFNVPPSQLRGDKAAKRELEEGLHFRRNPRVVRVIFMATPHRGSQLADSLIGRMAGRLIQLPAELRNELFGLAAENRDVATPQAKAFQTELNFSAVHTLSPRDPVLQTMAELPIEIPFHSIIGQRHPGPVETSSDGVVAYTSAHLDGAASELVVRSGHGVASKPEAQAEVKRILRMRLQQTPRA